MRSALIVTLLSSFVSPMSALAQAAGASAVASLVPTDSNIVFANVGNASLVMDVFRPPRPNGIGIIFISGSGWGTLLLQYPRTYDDPPLRKDAQIAGAYGGGKLIRGLIDHGYTVFSIDHRFAPEAHFPALFYDAQRAVRFVRASASHYGIDPAKLGAIGHSSGAHLAAMLGVKDTVIDNPKNYPYQRGSSQVQAVVTLAAPLVMSQMNVKGPSDYAFLTDPLGSLPKANADGTFPLTGVFAAASPITFVTPRSAPMLIYQAEDDPLVLKSGATLMAARLAEAGVPHELRMLPTGGHAPAYSADDIDAFFRRYLK